MMRPIDSIIIHCSDSPDDRYSVNAAEIGRWHRARGWRTIGYHFVILRDGTIEVGRPLDKMGAHAYGHNMFSIGICLVGRHDFSKQMSILHGLVTSLQGQFGITKDRVKGHCEVEPNKTCPNFDMNAFRESLSQ